MFERKEKAPTEGAQVPVENFSSRYVNFLTGSCNAHLCDDGIFRNSKGARYCSCEMCGQVAVSNFGGEYCLIHQNHHQEPGEADFFTQRMHHYRKALGLAKAMPQYRRDAGGLLIERAFAAVCAEAGIDLGFAKKVDPVGLIERHIAMEWEEEKLRRAARSTGSTHAPDKREIVKQKLSNLLGSLSSGSINPTFGGR